MAETNDKVKPQNLFFGDHIWELKKSSEIFCDVISTKAFNVKRCEGARLRRGIGAGVLR